MNPLQVRSAVLDVPSVVRIAVLGAAAVLTLGVTSGKRVDSLVTSESFLSSLGKPLVGELDTGFPGERLVLINLWATWCAPCRREVPDLVILQAKHRGQLAVIGISLDDPADASAVEDFSRTYNVNYPIFLADERLRNEFGSTAGIPASFLMNDRGEVLRKFEGLVPLAELEGAIQKASLLR